MRIDDTAFALNECGLLMQRLGEVDHDGQILITRQSVDKVAKEIKLKKPFLSPAHILLDQELPGEA
jgi:hypothetical protein